MRVIAKNIKGFWIELELERKKKFYFIGVLHKTFPSAQEFYIALLPTLVVRFYIQDMRMHTGRRKA